MTCAFKEVASWRTGGYLHAVLSDELQAALWVALAFEV
ncbi:hypothetical protein FHX77_000190 [Bifidobacterium commune]|nr:hypothetical protein [Bifidobacterium commune]